MERLLTIQKKDYVKLNNRFPIQVLELIILKFLISNNPIKLKSNKVLFSNQKISDLKKKFLK
jgi:hypothetical protein